MWIILAGLKSKSGVLPGGVLFPNVVETKMFNGYEEDVASLLHWDGLKKVLLRWLCFGIEERSLMSYFYS